ncbi:MAG TPA: MBL fold metallo-hydrolase [Candidatus Udaeobacter sp.]|jgi:tetratricopeptide (TPR) repeat protein
MKVSSDPSAKRHRKLLQFRKLFWKARRSLLTSGVESDAADEAYSQALKFIHENNLGVEALLDASLLDAQQKPEAGLQVLNECASSMPKELRGHFHHARGVILRHLSRYDEALVEADKAFKAENFDGHAYALFSRALTLGEMQRTAEAIDLYHKVLREPGFRYRGDVWHNLGVSYGNIGEFQKAIWAFKKAVRSQGYDTPGLTLTGLGFSYLRCAKTKEALKAFQAALKSPEIDAATQARARVGISQVQAHLGFGALSQDDLALAVSATAPSAVESAESPEPALIAKIKDAGDTQYDKYLNRPSSDRNDTFSVLRGWSSAVTLMEGSERRWRGGGYFLKWRCCGIVIDPGFDFLRNFHDARYHGREVDVVAVTHNHPDHNSDLNAIDDLRYELYRRRTQDPYTPVRPYLLFMDQDTQTGTKFGYEAPEHHYEPIVMPSGFPQLVDAAKHPAKLPFRLTPFKVNHGADVAHAMGFVVELLDKRNRCSCRIGYTGDTEFFPDLASHLLNCDMLIAHISQPGMDELIDDKKAKSLHLGYRGTIRLLQESKPKLALIGEFWAGFSDLRIDLVKALRVRSGFTGILPAGLGLHIRLPSLEIECTQCHKPVPFERIRVSPPSDRFGDLSYLCPDCVLS